MTGVSTVDMTRSPTAFQYGIIGDRLQTEQTCVVVLTLQVCVVWSHQVSVVLSHQAKGSITCLASGLRTGSSMSVKHEMGRWYFYRETKGPPGG